MDKNRNYSLNTDNIVKSVTDFVSQEDDLSLKVEQPNSDMIVCRISNNHNVGIVTFYLKKNGLVSINIQGSKLLNNTCEKCCDFVIQQTSIPNSLRKNFTIRGCKFENIDYFKTELIESYKYSISYRGFGNIPNVTELFDVEKDPHTRVTCTLYSNNTFLLQGNVTSLYVTVLTECLNWLVNLEIIDSVPSAISLNNTTHSLPEDINILVPNLSKCGDTDGVLNRMILTSVALFNSGVVVEDFGCYTFGILKALEGVLKLRLSEDLGTIDKLGNHFYFDVASHRHRLNTIVYDGVIDLKRALTNGYNTWVTFRHSTFHADEQISTSTILSYEQAYDFFLRTLECINNICNNWH